MNKDEIIKKLIREYLSKCKEYGCDSCMAQTFCISHNLRKNRYPQEYCENNLHNYLIEEQMSRESAHDIFMKYSYEQGKKDALNETIAK